LDRRLGGPQSRSGRGGEEKIIIIIIIIIITTTTTTTTTTASFRGAAAFKVYLLELAVCLQVLTGG
jgi:hypothetical protein